MKEQQTTPYLQFALVLATIACACHDPGPAPDAQSPQLPRRLVLLAGNSNAIGIGRVKLITSEPELAAPYPAVMVTQRWHFGPKDDPITWTDVSRGPLEPHVIEGRAEIGMDVSLMRDLDTAAPGRWELAKIGVGSSNLVHQWGVDGVYPSDANLYAQLVDFVAATELATDSKLFAIVWILGEADATTKASADAYEANASMMLAGIRDHFGDVPVYIDQLSAMNTYPYQEGVRDGEARLTGTLPDCTMVDVDDLPMDLAPHFSAEGYITMGHRFAAVMRARQGRE